MLLVRLSVLVIINHKQYALFNMLKIRQSIKLLEDAVQPPTSLRVNVALRHHEHNSHHGLRSMQVQLV